MTLPFPDRFALSQVAATAAFIVAVMALAFGLRAAGLSTYGFNEDEISKVHAIEQYRRGYLAANAEHPMLMKLAMLASAYYVERSGRTDRRVRSLSTEGPPARDGRPSFVIVQAEYLTFKNRGLAAHLRAMPPWRSIYASETLAAQIFRVPRS